jgi:hypothetical protein
MLPRDEAATILWTDEMRSAWGIALPLLNAGEDIPARMAFKEAYIKAVAAARDTGVPTNWQASLGHDADEREAVVRDAVERGLISSDHATNLLPAPRADGGLITLLTTGNAVPLLESMKPTEREAARPHIENLKNILGAKRKVSE